MIRAGLGFGALGVTIRGTTKYHLSPMEQKAFAGAISQGLYQFSNKHTCIFCLLHIFCLHRSAQHLLEGEEVFLHRGAPLHPVLSDLHGD